MRKRHPLWGSGIFPAGGGEAGGPVRDGWSKEVRVRREGVADEEPVAALEVVRAFRRKPFGAMPRSGHAHAGREAQGRFQFSERDAAGIVELVPAQESAYRMERGFGFHGGLHIAEALRARAEFRPCGENPGHGVLLPVDLQLLAQDHESPALGINGHTAHGVFPDFRQMRGIREAFGNHFGESAAEIEPVKAIAGPRFGREQAQFDEFGSGPAQGFEIFLIIEPQGRIPYEADGHRRYGRKAGVDQR